MYAGTNYNPNNKLNPYLVTELTSAKPEELILKIYDFAILNCKKDNMIKTNDALQVLINSLNFGDPQASEISMGLMRLYEYCQEQMRKHNSQAVLKVLMELKDAWVTALNKG
ncbi:MAG: flagellar protein FliS [Ignavibacteriaceae bacterium]|jgi:flagellar protein FliS|nr:flagellar protein FliS [Ignavibacteriaceae bacterium]